VSPVELEGSREKGMLMRLLRARCAGEKVCVALLFYTYVRIPTGDTGDTSYKPAAVGEMPFRTGDSTGDTTGDSSANIANGKAEVDRTLRRVIPAPMGSKTVKQALRKGISRNGRYSLDGMGSHFRPRSGRNVDIGHNGDCWLFLLEAFLP
jgi:hypothetical protein